MAREHNNEEQQVFRNNSVMVTDLLERKDPISVGLVEYFRKNFAISTDEIKKRFGRSIQL